jgi:hypothetical protein
METPLPQSLETDPPGWKSREVRLGVVMYGGVSLAIYIYGVAMETYQGAGRCKECREQ